MESVTDNIEILKYSNYKDSGIKWLGAIPSHWEPLSNKYIFKLKKNQVGKKSKEYTLLSLTLNGVIKRDMDNPQGKFPAEFDTYQEVKKGDFIFCLFDVEETPRTVGLSDYDGMITGAYTVLEPHPDFDKTYLYYFYLNLDADKRMKPLYTGLRNTISKEAFFSFTTFVPPKPEQTAIARFLDRKTAQIDKAIAQKEKLIGLLKERQQILIQNAVTKGLNPNVKMKDSGVEWIGEIPEHWETVRLKHLARIRSGDFVSNDTLKDDGRYEVYGGNGFMGCTDRYNTDDERVIIGRVGAYCGNVRYINSKKWISDNALILTLNAGASYKYISVLLQAADLNTLNASNAQPLITGGKVLNVSIPMPGPEEQERIYQYIENAKTKIREAIDYKQKEIEALKEYKATLINSAVTGKIKVPDLETMN